MRGCGVSVVCGFDRFGGFTGLLDGEGARLADKGSNARGNARGGTCARGTVLFAYAIVVLLALLCSSVCSASPLVWFNCAQFHTCFFTEPRNPPSRAAQGLLDIALYASWISALKLVLAGLELLPSCCGVGSSG